MDKEIKVAVIDSGYHPSNIYSDIRINRERKIVLEGESICKSSIAISTHMHGTYVLNTIQKYSKTRKVLYDIYNIFDEQGKASSKALICALEEIVEYPVDIIVISLTCSANHKKKLVEVINILKNKNIYILAAANNKLGNNYPACLSEVFGVKGKALFRNNIIYYKPNVEFRNVLLFEKKSSNLQVLPGFKNLKDININSLKFGYNKRIIFDDANIILEKGKINYILGKSGVGKTTFAKILCGNLKKAEGYIKIENCKYNLKNIDLNNSISIVPQENIIFEDTVYNNLVMHNQNILFDTVKRVCTECEIYCDILNMSKGFNTKIDGSLSTLSGGQLKRIALARAILQSKEILIVDEPTAGLDMESAKKIGVLLKKYATMKIIIVITHDRNIIFNNQNTYIIKNRMFYKIEKDIEE